MPLTLRSAQGKFRGNSLQWPFVTITVFCFSEKLDELSHIFKRFSQLLSNFN